MLGGELQRNEKAQSIIVSGLRPWTTSKRKRQKKAEELSLLGSELRWADAVQPHDAHRDS